jgi:hypothetical protein
VTRKANRPNHPYPVRLILSTAIPNPICVGDWLATTLRVQKFSDYSIVVLLLGAKIRRTGGNMMPTAAAIANLKLAEQEMYSAQKELMKYISTSDRFTTAGIAEHQRLVDKVMQKTSEYMEAFKTAQAS